MYFGKFLIEKSSIDIDKILDATIEQMESIPSLLRVLKDEKTLSYEVLLELLSKNIESGLPMLSIIKEEKLLDNNAMEAILEKQFSSGKRLSQILIEKNLISYSELERLIEEFSHVVEVAEKIEIEEVSPDKKETVVTLNDAALESLTELGITIDENEGAKQNETAQTHNNKPELNSAAMESLKELGISMDETDEVITPDVMVENEEVPELNSAAIESLKELGITIDDASSSDKTAPAPEVEVVKETVASKNFDNLDTSFVGQLLELFDDEKFETISNSIKLLAKGPNEEVLKSIHHELKTILGAAKLSKTQLMPKLLIAWESVIEHILGKNVDFTEVNFLTIASNFKMGIRLSWDLREQIEGEENETGLLKNQEWKEKYMTNLKAAIAFIK